MYLFSAWNIFNISAAALFYFSATLKSHTEKEGL